MPPQFPIIFARLRQILERNTGTLTVTEDTTARYCLTGGRHPTHKTPMAIAWVQIGRGYVSYHLMPVYGCPKLIETISPKLKARMQGKSCFNFKASDEELFEELERLTVAGFEAFKRAGYLR